MKGEITLEKENLQRIQILESVLKEGIAIINSEETQVEENPLYTKYLFDFRLLPPNERLKKLEELSGSLEETQKLAYLVAFSSEQGLLKMQYFNKIILLSKRGLLNTSKKTKGIIHCARMILEFVKQKEQEANDKEKHLIPAAAGLYWDMLMLLDDINECNDDIKCCIRNEYYDMAGNYLNSILQRKISLNSKKLAILNYIKQIQDKSVIFSPYEIKYTIYSEDYLGRKCDKEYHPYRLKK